LTSALQNANQFDAAGASEKELFRAAGNKNVEIGAKCLHRRNLNRLKFHQNLARTDLIKIFGEINGKIGASEKFRLPAVEFVKLLDDVEAQTALDKIFSSDLQTVNGFAVRNLEKEVWKPKENKPLPANQIPLNLQTMSAAATTRKPD